MKKEVVVAIVLGFVLGLVITFGVWSANNALTKQKELASQQNTTPEESTVTPLPTIGNGNSSFTLTLVKPEDESISTTDKITLSGTSSPNTRIAVIWETGETVLQADKNGDFDTDISLISGINEIKVTAFSDSGQEISKTTSVVYSTEQI